MTLLSSVAIILSGLDRIVGTHQLLSRVFKRHRRVRSSARVVGSRLASDLNELGHWDGLGSHATGFHALLLDVLLVDLELAFLHSEDVKVDFFGQHVLFVNVDVRVGHIVDLGLHLAVLVFSDSLADLDS